jgi:hypothetical protein
VLYDWTRDRTSPLAVHFSSEISFNSESAVVGQANLSVPQIPLVTDPTTRLTQNADKVEDGRVSAWVTDDPPSITVNNGQVGVENSQGFEFGVTADFLGRDEHSVGGVTRGNRVEGVSDNKRSDGGFNSIRSYEGISALVGCQVLGREDNLPMMTSAVNTSPVLVVTVPASGS